MNIDITEIIKSKSSLLILLGAAFILIAAMSGLPIGQKVVAIEMSWRYSIIIIGVIFFAIGLLLTVKELHDYQDKKSDRTTTPEKFDVFISSPILGLGTDEKYQAERENILKIIEVLKSVCGFNNISWVGKKLKTAQGRGLLDVELKETFQELRESKYYFGLFPEKAVTGAHVEAGFALALEKSCIIFVKDKKDLPTSLMKTERMFPYVKIYEYSDTEDLLTQLRESGRKIFQAR